VTATPKETGVVHYLLDKNASRFTVRAFATGMLSALGHSPTFRIGDFNGEVDFDSAAPGQASLRIKVRADSLEVMDDIKNKDRKEIQSTMNQTVLETSKYPAIVYESSGTSPTETVGEGRYKVTLKGNLSMRGETRGLPITAQVTITGNMLRAYGEFSILQSDYGIPPVSVAGGALKLKDELKFAFEFVARKQE
jgi:polyisoprenoid-binding protein YceI